MTDLVRETHDRDGQPELGPDNKPTHVAWLVLIWAILRFIVYRFMIKRAVDRPWFDRINEHPELCVTFGAWLSGKNLGALRSMFEIPITLMGYGEIDEIAAPYALKFMSLGTFVPMVLRQVPLVGWLLPWPRSFVFGFQRLWETVSWRLNVRHDVTVRGITRHAVGRYPVQIDLEYPMGIFNRAELNHATLWFDHLVIASARVHSLQYQFDIDDFEHSRLEGVETDAYCMTTFHPKGGFKLPRPVVCVVPFKLEPDPQSNPPRPWAVVQLWAEETPMLQCYTKLPREAKDWNLHGDHLEMVRRGAEIMVERLGGERAGKNDPQEALWEHYEQWPYFGHVSAEQMKGGFFKRLEEMQGYRNTYWVGGATNFELVEVIVRAAKALVEKHFLGRA